jgi:hypothetical protein
MNTNASDPWERAGWQLISSLAVLIIPVSVWVALERSIRSIVAFGTLISKPEVT